MEREYALSSMPRGKGSNGNQYRSGNAHTISQNVPRNYEWQLATRVMTKVMTKVITE